MPRGTPDKLCEGRASTDCFVLVPGGSFWMGAQSDDPEARNYDPEASAEEGPVHQVTLSPFWMQRFEASALSYRDCVRSGRCSEDHVLLTGGYSTYTGENKRFHPITSVAWEGAVQGCAELGGRLPTEAQWEYAARGTEARRFAHGEIMRCSDPDSGEVGCGQAGPLPPTDREGRSPFGLVAMTGNVWEWTADRFDRGYYGRSDAVDPPGPEAGSKRVIRGGGWTFEAHEELRAARRVPAHPSAQTSDLGYRCVVD